MGYSCTRLANETYDRIQEREDFRTRVEGSLFTEIGRENKDGAITGKVYRLYGPIKDNMYCKNIGQFRIAPNGMIEKFPGIPKTEWGLIEIPACEKKFG